MKGKSHTVTFDNKPAIMIYLSKSKISGTRGRRGPWEQGADRPYVNLQPARNLRGIESPLRDRGAGGIDFIIVRENNEEEYSNVGGMVYADTNLEMAVQESKGIANPVGQILSGAMMLDHLGYPEAARVVEDAVEQVIGEESIKTPDLGGKASTKEVGAAVSEWIER